jgi:hypothetical protein
MCCLKTEGPDAISEASRQEHPRENPMLKRSLDESSINIKADQKPRAWGIEPPGDAKMDDERSLGNAASRLTGIFGHSGKAPAPELVPGETGASNFSAAIPSGRQGVTGNQSSDISISVGPRPGVSTRDKTTEGANGRGDDCESRPSKLPVTPVNSY